jgi:transcription initiation factor TFIID TATA-box-binding protein
MEFKVQNMVGSCAVNFQINLEELYHSPRHSEYCTFNPETFPGLIFNMANPKVCLLIFASGKIVLTGAKRRQDIDEAFAKIQPHLR